MSELRKELAAEFQVEGSGSPSFGRKRSNLESNIWCIFLSRFPQCTNFHITCVWLKNVSGRKSVRFRTAVQKTRRLCRNRCLSQLFKQLRQYCIILFTCMQEHFQRRRRFCILLTSRKQQSKKIKQAISYEMQMLPVETDGQSTLKIRKKAFPRCEQRDWHMRSCFPTSPLYFKNVPKDILQYKWEIQLCTSKENTI